ncbi:MAG: 16S rRNA (uracil(1498)-N(3))-methyltransferase [Planctomycetota bacterium]
MPDRYFSTRPIDGATVTLDGSEAHHLLHVMRAKPGLELTVFDGHGGEYAAEIAECKRSTVELAVGKREEIERELPFELTLAVALPKGDRQRWLIEKCTELGVTRLVPLQTARSVSKVEKKEKLTRYVIEASKQCGRNRLMKIAALTDWTALLSTCTMGTRMIAHPQGEPIARVETRRTENEAIYIAIGPEGGFTDEEVASTIESGWQHIGLGERILRIETAALALAAHFAIERRI